MLYKGIGSCLAVVRPFHKTREVCNLSESQLSYKDFLYTVNGSIYNKAIFDARAKEA